MDSTRWRRDLRSVVTSGWLWLALWVLSRSWMLGRWSNHSRYLANDVNYYAFWLDRIPVDGLRHVMVEYPVPVVWILRLLYSFAVVPEAWMLVFGATMAAIDLGIACFLWRSVSRSAGVYWMSFTFANGAIMWFRFDLVPAAVVCVACVWLFSHPRASGALIAVGAAIKLWPALLIAPLAAVHPFRRRSASTLRLVWFAIVGASLALASLVATGWTRTASPLGWQSDRGLQVESVPATWLMFLHAFAKEAKWETFMSPYNALELKGPGVEFWLRVADVATVGVAVFAALITWRLWRRGQRDAGWDETSQAEAIVLAVLAIIVAMIVANKTFSTQYLLWVGGPIAALLTRSRSAWLQRPLRVVAGWSIALGLATQYIYPWAYGPILRNPQGEPFATAVLVTRNLGMVWLCGYTIWLAWRATATARSAHDALPRPDELVAPPPSQSR